MNVRDFIRGGYREGREGGNTLIVVLSGNEVAGVWAPGMLAVDVRPERLTVHREDS